MRRRTVVDFVIANIAAACFMLGCDDSSSTTPATFTPASQPWMTRPKGADEMLAAATRPATTTATTTASATTRVDPQSQPKTTIDYMYELIKADRFVELREVMVESSTPSEMRDEFANSIAGFKRGAAVSAIDSYQFKNAAIVIVRSTGSHPDDRDVGHFLLIQRDDRWKVLPVQQNAKRLTPLEKQNLIDVMHWGMQRIRVLRSPQTQPATTTASTRPQG